MVAAARRASKVRGVGAGAGLGQAVAGEMLHRAEPGQEAPALLVVAEAVDHPGGHVVDRDVGRGARQAAASSSMISAASSRAEPAAADVVAHIDAAEAQRGRLAQHLLGKDLLDVPARGLGQHAVGRELSRRVAEGLLVFGEGEIHARRIISEAIFESMKPLCWAMARHDRTGKGNAARTRLGGEGPSLWMVVCGRHDLPRRRRRLGVFWPSTSCARSASVHRWPWVSWLSGRPLRHHDPAAPASDACWSPRQFLGVDRVALCCVLAQPLRLAVHRPARRGRAGGRLLRLYGRRGATQCHILGVGSGGAPL